MSPMRTLAALIAPLALACPALAQTLPIDVMTGRGALDSGRPYSGGNAWGQLAGAQWRLAVIDTRPGLLTVTEPGGKIHTDVVPPGGAAGSRAMSIGVSATVTADKILFTGYTGGQTQDYSTIPTVGAAYAGRLGDFPAGSTAVWSKVLGQPGDQGAKWGPMPYTPRFSMYAIVGGKQVLAVTSY